MLLSLSMCIRTVGSMSLNMTSGESYRPCSPVRMTSAVLSTRPSPRTLLDELRAAPH